MNAIQKAHQKIDSQWKALLQSNVDTCEASLDNLLDAYQELGEYNPSNWDSKNVRIWFDNCTSLSKLPLTEKLIPSLRFKLSVEKSEGASFIFQELLWNNDKTEQRNLVEILDTLDSFPKNHWFQMIYCNIACSFDCNNNELDDLEKRFSLSLAHLHSIKQPDQVAGYYLMAGVGLFHKYLKNLDMDSAKRIRERLENDTIFQANNVFADFITNLSFELSQAQSLMDLQRSVEQKVSIIAENANKKGFEQLVIFTAIITFVITAAGSIMSNPLQLWALAGLGATLITFVLCVLLFLDKPKFGELLVDFRFYVLAISTSITIWIATIAATDQIKIDCIINCTYSLEVDSSFSEPKHEEYFPLPPLSLQVKK
ncbi:hypothetical protein MID13_09200 [Vibrio gigantis]|uniref:hypothetical protein n=1 Tax=Vibrio gigantis TaxID=296199 RepID=UPI001EFBD444|nr:hypothetical protein [Vibrio gigantis]ULN63109.1 hypothetical protein MID13_09200 [Vibrio gigantis]